MVSTVLPFTRNNSSSSSSSQGRGRLYASRICIAAIVSFASLQCLIGYLYLYTGPAWNAIQSSCSIDLRDNSTCNSDDKRSQSSLFRMCNANDTYDKWADDIHLVVVSSLCVLACVHLSRLCLTSFRDQDDLGTFANYLSSLTVNTISAASTASTLFYRWGGTCEDVFGYDDHHSPHLTSPCHALLV